MTETQIRGREIKRVVKAHWNDRAATFDDQPHHGLHSPAQREAWLAVLRRLTGGWALRVLDIGCGTGFLTLLLAELSHLPLYGGTPPSVLTGMLAAAGLHDVRVDALMDTALWGEAPDHERYLLTAVHA